MASGFHLDERVRPESGDCEKLVERPRLPEHRVEADGDHDPRQDEGQDRQRTQRSPAPKLVVREDGRGGQSQREARDRRQRGLIGRKAEQPQKRRELETGPRYRQRNSGERVLERDRDRDGREPADERLEVRSRCQRLCENVREHPEIERVGEDRAEEREGRHAVVEDGVNEDDADRQVEHDDEDDGRRERRQGERAALEPATSGGWSMPTSAETAGSSRSGHGPTGWRIRAQFSTQPSRVPRRSS